MIQYNKILIATICLIFMVLAAGCSQGFTKAASDDRLTEVLHHAIRSGNNNRHVALYVELPDRYQYAGAAGTGRIETGESMTTDHQFTVASVAKTMTAVLVYQLWEEGAFGPKGLDTTIAELDVFEPEVVDALHQIKGVSYGRKITIRHLLQHTSGLRCLYFDDETTPAALLPGTADGAAPNSLVGTVVYHEKRGLAAMVACTLNDEPAGCDPQNYLLARRWSPWNYEAWKADTNDRMAGLLNFYLSGMNEVAFWPPGEGFHYSDTNYVLLGIVIEHLTGNTLHHQLRTRIFDPLNMDHTYLRYATEPSTKPYEGRLADVWAWDAPMMSGKVNLSFNWGGGGVVSTLKDLNTFVRALAAGKLYKNRDTLSTMLKVPEDVKGLSYASGLVVFPVKDGLILHLTGSNGTWIDYHTTSDLTVIGTVDDFHGMMNEINFRGEVYKALAASEVVNIPIRRIPSPTVILVSCISILILVLGMVTWLIAGIRARRKKQSLPQPIKRARWLVVIAVIIHVVLSVVVFLLVANNPVQVMFGFTSQARTVMLAAWYVQIALTFIIVAVGIMLWLRTEGRLSDRINYTLIILASIAYSWAFGAMGLT